MFHERFGRRLRVVDGVNRRTAARAGRRRLPVLRSRYRAGAPASAASAFRNTTALRYPGRSRSSRRRPGYCGILTRRGTGSPSEIRRKALPPRRLTVRSIAELHAEHDRQASLYQRHDREADSVELGQPAALVVIGVIIILWIGTNMVLRQMHVTPLRRRKNSGDQPAGMRLTRPVSQNRRIGGEFN